MRILAVAAALVLISGCASTPPPGEIVPIPCFASAAEGYFSPAGDRIVCNAIMAEGESYHTWTCGIDGSDPVRLNDEGEDACSYFAPDGEHVLLTSTRDHPEMPKGSWHDARAYPQGAELYVCRLDGSERRRLTDNQYYDAEVTASPNGDWILFSRQVDGHLDLYRMRPDGTGELRITNTPDWQEGGSFYMPDNETIIYRAWKIQDEEKQPKPMALFTVKHDGTEMKQLTDYEGTHWAPFPSPDGSFCVYAEVFPGQNGRPNFDIVKLDLETGEETRLTTAPAFDGFPALSPDGEWLLFSSSRGAAPGTRSLNLFRMRLP